uniref:Uncharacterized protein n=1 Tax=Ditylenchus dipsaci TaxID=166011 RepID=A0A915DTD0_9BILA
MPATLCAIKKTKITFYYNILGDRFAKESTEMESVTVEECRRMIQHKTCRHGQLRSAQKLSQTTNKVEVEFPGKFMSIFKGEQTTEVSNCYTSGISVSHSHNQPIAWPLSNTAHCWLKDGHCSLEDQSVTVWTPPTNTSLCKYSKMASWEGNVNAEDNSWTSTSGEFVLTFTPKHEMVQRDCKTDLVTDSDYCRFFWIDIFLV